MWDHELWDRGHGWWRTVAQGLGAVVGYALAELRGSDRFLLFALIGMVYGTLLVGLAYHYRESRAGDDLNAWQLFLAHIGAALGFTYFFFLFGTSCQAGRLILSPIIAGLGGVAGAALGLVLRPRPRA
jgi:hypothetical protein